MELEGTVHEGVVVLDAESGLPEGTRVTVAPREAAKSTLGQRLQWLVGSIEAMPADFAAEHDHYIHGTPRRTTNGAE